MPHTAPTRWRRARGRASARAAPSRAATDADASPSRDDRARRRATARAGDADDDATRDDADATRDATRDGDGAPYRAAATPTRVEYEFALRAAIEHERYEDAARLRDALDADARDATRAVEDANERFYRAFRAASVDAMREVWADGAHVQCAHPGAARVAGARDVMASWAVVFAAVPEGGADVRCADVRVHAGDGWGFATCVERVGGGGTLAATNVFERQRDGSWRMVLHHAHGVVALGA